MLDRIEQVPEGLLDCAPGNIRDVLPRPTLMHLQGRRKQPLFVSVLLHGNETVGLLAVQRLLKKYQGRELPRSLSVFFGNVTAAEAGLRRLDGQPDYNRVWPCGECGEGEMPEHRMMEAIVRDMQERDVFASVDVHNNTGLNPHYACINVPDHRFFHLATLFSRTVVYFTRPLGVQTLAFSPLCPSVTLECGRVGDEHGIEHAVDYLDACLHLSVHPEHDIAEHDIDLFHTIGIVKVNAATSFGFDGDAHELVFDNDIDHMNFRECAAGTRIGRLCSDSRDVLQVWDNDGRNIAADVFDVEGGDICFSRTFMPSMLTLDERVIRQDCLCYLMERYSIPG